MTQQNSRWLSLLLCLCVWSIGFSSSVAAERVPPIEKTVVYKGIAYACTYRTKHMGLNQTGKTVAVFLHFWNLAQATEAQAVEMGYTEDPLRWSVAHQHCWVTSAWTHPLAQRDPPLPMYFRCVRGDLDLKTGLPAKDESLYYIDEVAPLADLASIGLDQSQFPAILYYDYVPVSEKTLQLFVLTNVRGTIERTPPKPGEPRTSIVQTTEEESQDTEMVAHGFYKHSSSE